MPLSRPGAAESYWATKKGAVPCCHHAHDQPSRGHGRPVKACYRALGGAVLPLGPKRGRLQGSGADRACQPEHAVLSRQEGVAGCFTACACWNGSPLIVPAPSCMIHLPPINEPI